MSTFGQWEAFCLSSSVQVFPLDVTTPRDSYAWNYRELATRLTLSELLAEVGLEPLTIGSMRRIPITELSLSVTSFSRKCFTTNLWNKNE